MRVQALLRRALNAVPGRALDGLFGWRHRQRWLDKKGLGAMYQSYFEAYRDRLPVARAIGQIFEQKRLTEASIIEFGCSGGNNLKLLREELPIPLRYCGLDIQEEAVAFARRAFPQDTFLTCSTEDLPAVQEQVGKADVLLASGVLYYLPQKEAQKVLDFAAAVTDRLVVCDILERLESTEGENDGLFLHPFRLMCKAAGFRIDEAPQPPRPGDRHGIFVARRDGAVRPSDGVKLPGSSRPAGPEMS